MSNMCEVAERLEQKGIAEGRTEIIKNMLSKGLGVEEIANLTGVDISIIREAASKLKTE